MFNTMYINKQNLIHNLNLIKKYGKAKICAMVKANAYGVGLKEVVALLKDKVDFFGVSNTNEADEIRALTKSKILIVGPLEKGKIKNYSYTCASIKDLKYLILKNRSINIHLKINTGMNRFGISPKQIKKALQLIKQSKLYLEGVFTHFATSDDFVKCQFAKFKYIINKVKQAGFNPIFHSDNSANFFKHKLDMVRVGFNLFDAEFPFKPVATISASVLQINYVKRGDLVGYDYNFVASKNSKIAVISIGYADGFLRGLIGKQIYLKCKMCKIINVCMDCFMLDVTNIKIKKDEKIFILNNKNKLINYANYLNTSPYEVMTNFSKLRANKIIK